MPELPPEVVAAAIEQAQQQPAAAAQQLPTGEPIGDLFKNYDPEGALGGMFAPAFIRGYQPSEDAVAAWNKQRHSITRDDVEQTRLPALWQYPGSAPGSAASVYGPEMPRRMSFLGNQGSVDPLALRVLAQGGTYDMEARRKAIAERLLANQIAQSQSYG